MIYIYPANRLENLVILLDRVMQVSQSSNLLNEEIILVQSKGMQHWLNLQLAQTRGISMNLGFRLPVQFFWEQIRYILGKEQVPERSPYTREVLSWRIDALLGSDEIINNYLCQEVTHYWFNSLTQQGNRDKRFQLAEQLADLFEQYQIFRPEWIADWSRNGAEIKPAQQWQALLWKKLTAQNSHHPVALLKQAIKQLAAGKCHLPERISLFGINSLPPLWLEFLSALGEHCPVHFFHLNPCVEYWGDIKTDKDLARETFYRWLKRADKVDAGSFESAINPLLANLGRQGQEFLSLLQEYSSIDIPLFESPEQYPSASETNLSVLEHIQKDILQLVDARQTPEELKDDSIVLTSAHSALREIQALHDWLLHQFNNDLSLTPRDVVVMCPNIENYAPYVEAVFSQSWYLSDNRDLTELEPLLPCSIADRTLKDAEPLVQAFMQCLELPDSRFQVSQILSFMRLPAVQEKFSFVESDLIILERWLKHASVHWGLDAAHKQTILDTQSGNNKFSWEQGLNRLLLGFAYNDQDRLYQEQLLLGDVEGDEALLLGRYIELLEQLQLYSRELLAPRKAEQWQAMLQQLKNELFAELSEDFNASEIIQQAIDELAEYTAAAQYKESIPLVVIRDFLQNHFNQPVPGRQFLSGQVTFCSMVPMRSLPFRIIAVLGLNDGEFPRQRQPLGFDLMARELPRKGDRSRREDDRYLFLEALISCREKLYLSYQGHDIKTNSPREPSLVLSELMDYLEKAYQWQLTPSTTQADIYKVPLQAFNKANYSDKRKSFSQRWLKLSESGTVLKNKITLPPPADVSVESASVMLDDLLSFFDHPSRYFAQRRLNLFLNDYQDPVPEDSEPFVYSNLDRYSVQNKIVELALENETEQAVIKEYIQAVAVSGNLPDTPDLEQVLTQWQQQATQFYQTVRQLNGHSINYKSMLLNIASIQIEAQLPLINNQILHWRLAAPKGKDDMRLWLYHLAAQIDCQYNGVEYYGAKGIYRGKDDNLLSVHLSPVEFPEQYLEELIACWKNGLQTPLMLNSDLGRKHCYGKHQKKPKPLTEKSFYQFFNGDKYNAGLKNDPYIKWFWQNEPLPLWENELGMEIEKIYDPLYQHREETQIEVAYE